MKNKILIVIIVLILIIVCITIINNLNNNKDKNETIENNYTTIDKNQISYKENVTVNDLKNDYGIKGDSNIYEIQTEYDGRKVLTVKSNLKYKVAFSGLIKNKTPIFEELDEIMQNNYPQKKGIWVEKNSRNKILNILNNSDKLNAVYNINTEGYLVIDENNNQTQMDEKIKNSINGDNQVILAISSICYIVDDVTGDILDYNFENMDKFQTYEYLKDSNNKIIFITENKLNQISNDNILEDIINIL